MRMKGLTSVRVAASLAALVALASPAFGEDPLRQVQIGASGEPNTAASGDLAVMQFATTDPDRLQADWQKPTAGAYTQSDSSMKRNQPIFTFLVFTGCSPDPKGNCNLTVDFETLGPDGSRYDLTKGAKLWVGYPPPPGRNLQLSMSGYGLRVEDKDPLGVYRIRATVTDQVSGKVLHTEESLTAEK